MTVPVSCSARTGPCTVALTDTITENPQNGKLVALGAQAKTTTKTVTLATTRVSVTAGRTLSVTLRLGAARRRLLASHHTLRTELTVTSGRAHQTVTFHRTAQKR